MAVLVVAMIAHIAMNLPDLRQELRWGAARVARVTGADAIDALRLGEDKAALKAMNGLRREWLVSDAELLAADGRTLATYRRGQDEAHLESAAAEGPAAMAHSVPRSEERRVGEEGRSRWAPDHLKKKEKMDKGARGRQHAR